MFRAPPIPCAPKSIATVEPDAETNPVSDMSDGLLPFKSRLTSFIRVDALLANCVATEALTIVRSM